MNQDSNRFKIILTSVFGFFILLGLLAFSTYKATNSANSSVDIAVWGTVDKTLFNNFLSKYKQDKNIEFKLTYTQKGLDTIDADLVEAIATGKAPDVILIPQELIKRYMDKVNYITSINERDFKDTYIQESEIYLHSSGIFALPFFVDPIVMYWNRDNFSSAGIANPPTKWSELPLLVGKLTTVDNNANIKKSLVSFGEYRNVDNAKALLSALMLQAGSAIVAPDPNGTLKSALYVKSSTDIAIPAVSALTFYTDYSNPQKSVYSWNRSLPSAKQAFISEDLSTYFGFASEVQDLKDKNPNLNFDVAMIPQVVNANAKVTFGELYGFAFLKSSPNTSVAFNLISTLTGPDAVATFLQFANVAPARRDLIATGTSDPAKTVFFNSALIAKGWIDPDATKTDQLFQTMVENISSGRMSVDDSVQTAGTELGNLLQ